ncbi:MAG: rod-binding protein [Lachnospiraceae bacterium]|nr:rod-binding protein [Lachnospiraceae bacterium]
MDIIGTTDYSSIINSTRSTDVEKTFKAKENGKVQTDEEMMEACKQFEAYMIEQVYKSMENTIMKSDEEEGDYVKMFGDMRVQQYAQAVTNQGGIGLARQLYEAMKNNMPTIDASEIDASADTSVKDAEIAAENMAVKE